MYRLQQSIVNAEGHSAQVIVLGKALSDLLGLKLSLKIDRPTNSNKKITINKRNYSKKSNIFKRPVREA